MQSNQPVRLRLVLCVTDFTVLVQAVYCVASAQSGKLRERPDFALMSLGAFTIAVAGIFVSGSAIRAVRICCD
jgi:hypothetical protein